MTKVGGYWREAATVILIARTPISRTARAPKLPTTLSPIFSRSFDYKVLLLKRSSSSSFMPEQHVFPGGTLSDADFDNRWIQLFERYTEQNFATVVKPFKNRKQPAPAFKEVRRNDFPAEIAFRICAIRECFEECGVLLAKEIKDPSIANKNVQSTSQSILSSKDLNSGAWRKRVNKDAGEFLTLCIQNNLVPDLWALQEWCNWLTPVMKTVSEPPAKPRRFDTLFYVCCLDAMPAYARVDGHETTVLRWESPGEFLAQHFAQKMSISGPQLYELSRMLNFTNVDKLRDYAVKREEEGIVRYLPVIVFCKDGVMSLLPGDTMYPEKPDLEGTQSHVMVDQTIAELSSGRRALNRTYRDKEGVWITRCNIPPVCGLIPPMSDLHYSSL